MCVCLFFFLFFFFVSFFCFFFANLDFQLQWQPIDFSSSDKIDRFGRGLLKENFCKTFVKISALG